MKVMPFNKDKFRVLEEFEFCGVLVPEGFETNGASVPRIFWMLFPPNRPKYLKSAVVHDFLTSGRRKYSEYIMADNKLDECLKAQNVDMFTRLCLVWSCRAYHLIRYKILNLKNQGEKL